MSSPRWRWSLAGPLALIIAATGGLAAAHAQPAAEPASAPVVVESYQVTLVTGDRLLVDRHADGRHAVTVDAAARDDGSYVTFKSIEDGEHLYVIPSDAARLVPDTLDRELFNVTKLAEYGYTEGVPVITTHDRPAAAARAAGLVLDSIGAVATTVALDGQWWQAVSGPRTLARSGVERVWLDERVEVSLAESVPMVGAPRAWDLGYDGTGVTVAVLDTGIDADHPDLAGKVVAEQNFTDSDTAGDRHGHGTHVAGIAAGTGAEFTGVAPGAELLNGKVLGDDGTGQQSDIIAGMEWAAEQGADVVNMSLGGRSASDGTDPLSQAVNALTAQHEALFAVAAGNNGPGAGTVASPGAADAALTVGAVDKAGRVASGSSRGPRVGDYALKPDLTAPGVDITSARADGTALGPVVGEHYTTISGTSMATPHVAGAAAILQQAEPDLTAAQLKARLVGAAAPASGPDVYQQGGGLLDIPAALAAPVQASPTPLDLGYLRYPHADLPAVTEEVTYTNLTGEPVTVALGLEVRSQQGAVPSPEMLSVAPASLTIAPGGSAAATVTLDPRVGDVGLYGGYLVSTSDGEVAARTPVGFYKEDERYDLTIIGIARDGRLAELDSFVGVLDVENMARFIRPGNYFVDGVVRLRLPPSSYSVVGDIHTYDAHDQDIQQTTFVADPEVRLDRDVTLVLDAREAVPITVETPDHDSAPQASLGHGYWRTAAVPGPLLGIFSIGLPATREYFAMPTDPVTLGDFETYTHWRMAAPEARLAVTDPVGLALDPVLMRPPAVDGEQVVRLVDAGDGTAADYSGVDAEGSAVLVRRGALPYMEQQEIAADAGAAAVIVTNDVPGRLVGELGPDGRIPVLSLTQAEGEELRSLLAGGEVTVRLSGIRWSPYLYNLVLVEPGVVPDRLDYTIDSAQLAALDVSYHNDVPGHQMVQVRNFLRPFHASYTFLHPLVEGARTQTEYLVGGDGLAYRQTVFAEQPSQARLAEPGYRSYVPGERTEHSWFRQVVRPGLLPEAGLTRRTGDTLRLEIQEWLDDAGNHFPTVNNLAPYPGDTITTRVFRDGELVDTTVRPQGSFPMAGAPADYRVELDVTREADWWQRSTATRTAWSFGSQPGDGVLPLLSVDYDLDLDLWNTRLGPPDRPGPPTVEFQVSQQEAGQPAVAGARLWVSYDDGETWRSRRVFDRGDGRFEAVLAARPPASGSGQVSVRVEAWDVDGNRIEQEVLRAWR